MYKYKTYAKRAKPANERDPSAIAAKETVKLRETPSELPPEDPLDVLLLVLFPDAEARTEDGIVPIELAPHS